MNFFHAVILGVVEGITEFLPISSTFHLIFTSKILGLKSDDFLKLFEVLIQSGAILSVVVLYLSQFKKDHGLLKNVFFSFLPTAVIGFLLHQIIKKVFFETNLLMISASFFVGLIFILVEILIKKGYLKINLPISKLSLNQALIIGLFQAVAVIPGVSRSGATILGLLLLGYNRPDAALYSFLLAIPTIIAAGAFDLLKTPLSIVVTGNHLPLLAVGFFSSFIFAYLSARWLINYLRAHTLTSFGLYRLVITPLLLLIFPS